MGQSVTLASPGPDRSPKRAVILLTSSGRRLALVNTLRTVAETLNVDLRIVACDRTPRNCPAFLLADAAYQVPDPQDANYIDALLEICLIHRVTMVLPTESPELAPLSRSRDRFTKIGTEIAISSPDIVELTSVPENFEASLFGSGFSGTSGGTDGAVETLPVAEAGQAYLAEPQRRDGSRQFDVLMYFDQHNQLRAIVPCERIIEGGVELLVTRRCAAIAATAEQLARKFHGLSSIISLDATLRRDGSVSVDRLNVCLSESFEVAHRAGAEFMTWLLGEHCFGSTATSDEWQDGVQMIRYDAAAFAMT